MPVTPTKKKVTKTKATSSYTYTGCWTCRRRHIKCDEGKPHCNRCAKAGFECQGYDFKFAGSDSSRSFRRPVAPGKSAQQVPALTNAQVTGILDELDSVTDSTHKGPFGLLSFSAQEATCKQDGQSPRSDRSVDLAFHPRVLKQESPSVSPPNSSHGLQPHPDIDVKDIALRRAYYAAAPTMVHEPHILAVSGRQSELFEHWTTFLCYNLSPLSVSLANPFRYTYPSLALEGLVVTPDMAAARLAVFHGICGTAAWSLSKMRPDEESYHALSVYHDQMALTYIQQTIEHPDGLRDTAIPAAIMSCLTGDIVSGRLELWGRHLRGGFRCLLTILAQQKTTDSTMSVLCQQYLLGAAFGKFGTATEIQTLQNGILDGDLYIEECHCITRPMLDSVLAINVLAASSIPRNPSEMDRVRDQLRQSVPKFEDPIRHHLSYSYYCAIWIHFSRSLAQAINTQQLASKAIDHLEWAKETGRGNCGQILMWLLFTIGPECTTEDLQTRLLTWCNSQLRVQVSSIKTFVAHLQKTWSVSSLPTLEAGHILSEEIKTESYGDT